MCYNGSAMIAKQEIWKYQDKVQVWVGKYKNSHNLLHWHYDCELLYVEKGSIDVFCGKQNHRLSVGEMLYVDSGQVHYMKARDPETILIVIIFNYDILRPYMGNLRLASPKLRGSYPIPQIYREIRDILLQKLPFFAGEATGKVIAMMASIFRNEELIPRDAADKTTERLMELLEEISNKCDEYDFQKSVSFMNMSEAYFSRYFKESTGISFSAYLNYVRTEKAISLLKSGENLTVTEIADKCGFGTIRNFNRIFKSLTGYSPSAMPKNYVLSDKFVYPSDSAFTPTLHDCELIEESGE